MGAAAGPIIGGLISAYQSNQAQNAADRRAAQDRAAQNNQDQAHQGYSESNQHQAGGQIGGSQSGSTQYHGDPATQAAAQQFLADSTAQYNRQMHGGGRGAGGAGGGGGGKGKGGGGKGKGPNWQADSNRLGQQIIGMADKPVPNLDAANSYIGDTLGPGGGNSVDSDLQDRYKNASFDDPNNLLRDAATGGNGGNPWEDDLSGWKGYDLTGGGTGGSTTGAGGGGAGGGGGHSSYTSGYHPAQSQAQLLANYQQQPIIGDEMSKDGFFQQQTKKLFDDSNLDPANDPTMQPYLDAMRRENQKALDVQLQDVGDEAAGAGMYGGSALGLERAKTRDTAIQDLTDAQSKALFGSRKEAYDRRMEALGLVNTRDMTGAEIAQRDRSDAANAAANASSGMASGAAAQQQMAWQAQQNALDRELDARKSQAQMQLDARNQNLGALKDYATWNGQGLAGLGDVAGRLDSRRDASMGRMTGMNDLRYNPLERGLGVADKNAQRANEQARWAAGSKDRAMDAYMRRLNFMSGLNSGSDQYDLHGDMTFGDSNSNQSDTSQTQTRPGGQLFGNTGGSKRAPAKRRR